MDTLVSWLDSPAVQALLAFAGVGFVVAAYGLVLEPAWFPPSTGAPPLPDALDLVARLVAATLCGALIGIVIATLQVGFPHGWALWGTGGGFLLALAVHTQVVANPAFPLPNLPEAQAGASLVAGSETVRTFLGWVISGGWVGLTACTVVGVALTSWLSGMGTWDHQTPIARTR